MLKLTRTYVQRRVLHHGADKREVITEPWQGHPRPAHYYTAPDNIVSMVPAALMPDDQTGVGFVEGPVTWLYTKDGYTGEDAMAVAHSPEEILAMIAASATTQPTLRQQYAMAALTGLLAADSEAAYKQAAIQACKHADALIEAEAAKDKYV